MTRAILLPLLLAPLAFAAPVPKVADAEAVRKRFGDWTDPEKVCVAKLRGDTLSLTLAGGLAPGAGKDRTNLPRLTREVAGDFTAVVRVRATLPARAKPIDGEWSDSGGGLVLARADGLVYRWGLHAIESGGERRHWLPPPTGFGPEGQQAVVGDEGLLLRAQFRAGRLELAYGSNGSDWQTHIIHKAFADEPLQVGVYATHNLTTDSVVTLSDFSLTQSKEAKK